MKPFQELPPGPSRLARQLACLGLGDPALDAPATPQAVAEERATLASVPLRPFLPQGTPRRRPHTLRWAAGMLLAACLAFVVVRFPGLLPSSSRVLPYAADVLTAKGRSSVTVYFERAGLVSALGAGDRLVSGDRVRAEVASAQDSVAALAVVTGDGRLLTDAAQVVAGSVFVPAGGARAFPASFRLVGAAEGEQLVVATCPARGREAGAAALAARLAGAADAQTLRAALAPGCDVTVTPLR